MGAGGRPIEASGTATAAALLPLLLPPHTPAPVAACCPAGSLPLHPNGLEPAVLVPQARAAQEKEDLLRLP